jgi:hypothetical protein
MGQPEFDTTIGKDGKLKLHVKGAKGAKCLELADLVRDIIGTEDSRQLTSEYYERETDVRMDVQIRTKRT